MVYGRLWEVAGLALLLFAIGLGASNGLLPLALSGSQRPGKHTEVLPSIDAHAGQAWPMLGGSPARNHVNTSARRIPVDFSVAEGSKDLRWTVKLGTRCFGSPVVADGKVFIGTNNESPRNPRDVDEEGKPIDRGILYCFNAADGKFLWQAVHDKVPTPRLSDWPRQGICSTPIVEGKRLWYVNNRAEVICADTEGFLDGKNDCVQDEQYRDKTDADILWRLDMVKNLKVYPHCIASCSPLIVGDTLFVVTSNGVDQGHIDLPSPEAPSFIALNKNTGKLLWAKNHPGRQIMHGQWSNPAYAEPNGRPQVIFPGGDGWLYGLEPRDGNVIWKFDANPKDAVYILAGRGTRNHFVATPVVHDHMLYIGVGDDPEHDEGMGHLYCIDISKTGDLSPELLAEGEQPSNVPKKKPRTRRNPNSGLVWHYGGPGKPPSGQRSFIFGRTLSSCAVHDGLVYVAELAGCVHCLDARTGKPLWVHEHEAVIWTSPMWADGKLFIGNDDGQLVIYAASKQRKILSTIEMGTRVRSTPAAAAGALFIATDERLFAVTTGR